MASPYKVNGTSFVIGPSTGHWVDRKVLGNDGNGHPIYPAVRSFELKWDFLWPTEFNSLYSYFQAQGPTGTSVVTLPQYPANSWTFFDYTGCILNELQAGDFFEQHYSNVVLVVTGIKT